MPKVSVYVRPTYRKSHTQESNEGFYRAVLLALRAKRQARLGEPNDSHLHVRLGRRTLEGVLAAPRGSDPTQTITRRTEVLRGASSGIYP